MDFQKLTDAQLIGCYRELRDRADAIKEKHKAELAPYSQNMSAMESELLRRMDEREVNSTATNNGTAYKSVLTSVKVANSGVFLQWLKDTDQWHLADIRGAKKEVESYMEEHEALPPGLDASRIIKCGVRKPTGVK